MNRGLRFGIVLAAAVGVTTFSVLLKSLQLSDSMQLVILFAVTMALGVVVLKVLHTKDIEIYKLEMAVSSMNRQIIQCRGERDKDIRSLCEEVQAYRTLLAEVHQDEVMAILRTIATSELEKARHLMLSLVGFDDSESANAFRDKEKFSEATIFMDEQAQSFSTLLRAANEAGVSVDVSSTMGDFTPGRQYGEVIREEEIA